MAVLCDVCKTSVPDGMRFCPQCKMEIVPARERAARPTPMEKEVFDWDEEEGAPKDYAIAARQLPEEKLEQLVETLRTAESRLTDGRVLDATATLKTIRPQVAARPKLRAWHERLVRVIEDRKQKVRERCERLTESRDGDTLCALLAGTAANELEPEEIARVALTSARVVYDARLADQAAELLRLPPFRTLRDDALVAEHRELELVVHRRRAWQHRWRSVAVLGSVILASGVVLVLVTLFAWHGSRTLGMAVLLLIGGAVAALVVFQKQIAKWCRQRYGDDSPTEVVQQIWRDLSGRRQ